MWVLLMPMPESPHQPVSFHNLNGHTRGVLTSMSGSSRVALPFVSGVSSILHLLSTATQPVPLAFPQDCQCPIPQPLEFGNLSPDSKFSHWLCFFAGILILPTLLNFGMNCSRQQSCRALF